MKIHKVKRRQLIYLTRLALYGLEQMYGSNVGHPDSIEKIYETQIKELKRWMRRRNIKS